LNLLANSFEESDDDPTWVDERDDFGDQRLDTIIRHDQKIGRNDPCPCGSGKKYKKCCMKKRVAR
jgi:uncharacterized protein YchJ